MGGTTTQDALETIEGHLQTFDGRFVVLGFGTNDYPPDFRMEAVVRQVIAAGRTPVVPRAPWARESSTVADLSEINNMIDALYSQYGGLARGPDLFETFRDRNELFENGDPVHPNADGRSVWRSEWAAVMAAYDPNEPLFPPFEL